MLEYVRTHQKIFQIILLILILPSFVFLGVESYTTMGGKDTDIAKVGKDVITGVAFENAVKNQAQRTGLPSELANSAPFKSNVLEQMIQQQLLKNELQSLRLQVSDERLAKELNRFPEIVALKKSDGSVDAEKYRQLLQSNGLSVAQFQNMKRSELMGADLQNAVSSKQAGIQSSVVSEKLIAAFGVEREVQVVFYLAEQYIKKIKLEESELKDYFQANPSAFQTTPTADIEYVVLPRDTKMDEKEFSKKADSFANIVYEQADSLQAVADQLKLSIQKEKALSAGGKKTLAKNHPLNDSKVLMNLFKDNVLTSNKNTEAIQLANGDLISVRVTQYNPAQTQNFEAVKTDIEKILQLKKAEEMAAQDGLQMVEQLQKDPKAKLVGKEFSKSVWVSRNRPLDLTGEPFEKIFGVPTTQFPQVVSAKIPGIGLAIYKVNQIRDAKAGDSRAQVEQFKQIAELNLQNELGAYYRNMRDRSPVKVLKSLQ
jgi:hypothetical protein